MDQNSSEQNAALLTKAAEMLPDGIDMKGYQVKELLLSLAMVMKGESDKITIGGNGHPGVEVRI